MYEFWTRMAPRGWRGGKHSYIGAKKHTRDENKKDKIA